MHNKKTFHLIYHSLDISNKIKNYLLDLNAFRADYLENIHNSQFSFLVGIKNRFCFYNIRKSLLLLLNAIRFLKRVKKKKVLFIFVGVPLNYNKKISYYFKKSKLNYIFFKNEIWHPGFISKNSFAKNKILIVYNVKLNNIAVKEAVYANIPVVGILTPSCNINGIDYPILLNFKNLPIWYLKFIFSILK